MQAKKMSEVEVKEVERIIEKNYGAKIDLSKYNLFINKKNEVYIASPSVKEEFIEISSYLGLYLGKLKRNEKVQLSVEGSQIVGIKATKNIAVLDDENVFRFMEGFDCKWKELINCELNNFVLIKNGDDFFGCGMLRSDKIESLVPKARRIMKSMKKV